MTMAVVLLMMAATVLADKLELYEKAFSLHGAGGAQERKEFAKRYEKSLLLKGIDAHVSVYNNTLMVKWVGVNRPFVYQFANEQKTLDTLLGYGFLVVSFDNGYGDSWQVLTPDGEVKYFKYKK